MGPKRKSPSRSKSPKKGDTLDTGFINALLSDEAWHAVVTFLIPAKVQDELYLEQLEKAAKLGRRRKFTWISKKDLVDQIIELMIQNKHMPPIKHEQFSMAKINRTSSRISRLGRIDSAASIKSIRPLSVMAEDDEIIKSNLKNPSTMSYNKINPFYEQRRLLGRKLSGVIEQNSGKAAKKSGTAQNADRMTPGLQSQLEAAKVFLDNKEDVPDSVLVKILKAKLLHIRNIEIEKKANLTTASEKKASNTKKDKSPSGKKTPVKNKKGGVGPLPEIDKTSQLRKKEDIEEEEKYLDDEPIDGADHYFLISGFYNPSIFTNCEELNILIDSIIKFKSRNYQRIKEFLKEIDDREKLETNLKANLKITAEETSKDKPIDVEALSEERQALMLKVSNELEIFWKDINMILENSNDKSILQNIARLKYTVEKDPNIKSWFELEPRAEFAFNIFNHISEKLFELVVQKRQFKNYLNCLKLYAVPPCLPVFSVSQGAQPTSTNHTSNQAQQTTLQGIGGDNLTDQAQTTATSVELDKSTTFDIRLYNELMDSIPSEYISTQLVLHCMVEQVVANDEKNSSNADSKSNNILKIQNLNNDVSQHFCELIMNLPLSQKEKENVLQYLPVTKQKTQSAPQSYPYLINYQDEIAVRLKTVTGTKNDNNGKFVEDKLEQKFPFDLLKTEYSILEKSPLTVFTGLPDVPKNLSRERASRLQELLHFCTTPEITYADADRAFKQFIFECMSLTEADENGSIILNDEYMVIPWDDPYPNINSTLSEEKQLQIKTMNIADQRVLSPQTKRKLAGASSAGTNSVKSIKFQDEVAQNGINPNDNKDSWGPSSILKSRPSTKLSVQSVHFDDIEDLTSQLEAFPTKTIEQVLEMIRNSRQRNLNEWYFAEHFEPKILVQVLKDAVYTHPFINTYYNKRDHSIMLVLSNPYSEKTLSNHHQSTIKLHSNVGFRNYLERIYDMIVEWTRDEEAKYQALLTSKEVQSFLSEQQQDNRSRPSSKSTKKDERSQSNSDKSKKKKDETPAMEEPYITNEFVSSESLKAWKKDHDKQVAEMQQRKVKSPKSKASADAKKDATKGKSPSRAGKSPSGSVSPKARSPARSPGREQSPGKAKKTSRSNSKSKSDEETIDLPVKKDNAFVGYDVGNNMIYIKDFVNHMFPCDGSLIKTEKIEFKTGSKTLITTSVINNGNVFSLHLVDPKKDKPENMKSIDEDYRENIAVHGTIKTAKDEVALAEEHKHEKITTASTKLNKEKINDQIKTVEEITLQNSAASNQNVTPAKTDENSCIAKYGCFTGSFKDGFSVSFSVYDMKPTIKIDATPQVIQPITQEIQNAAVQSTEDKQAKKPEKKKGKKEPTPEPVEIKEPPKYKVLPWSQLFLSAPTGLSCTFVPELYSGVAPTADNEPHRLLVKQYYSVKSNTTAAESLSHTNSNMYKEKTRLFRSDGVVIKMMNDDTIEIFYPNGSIYKKEIEIKETVLETDIETPAKEKTKSKKKSESRNEESNTPRDNKTKLKWTLTTPSGNKYALKQDKTYDLIGYNRNIIAHDPQTNEVMSTREDGVKIINRPDGSSIVDYADGTRITTFYVQHTLKINDNETGEVAAEKRSRLIKYYKIECYGFATTIFNNESSECTLVFGNGTFVTCNPEKTSYVISHHRGDKLEIDSRGVTSYTPKFLFLGENKDTQTNKFLFYQNSDTVLDYVDYDGNIFKVDKFGKCTSLPVDSSQSSVSSESLTEYNNHAPRFFIVHKDSSGTELLRYQDIHDYMREADLDPMAAIMRDGVQGYPNVMGTTVLKPLKNSINETWARDYDEKDITPQGLKCRNLHSFPSDPDVKIKGPKFATKLGKGLHIEPQQTEIVKNPPLVIPKRMEYRQIIEYEKLSDEIRSVLMEGLKNYILYVAERAERHRLLLAHDPRSEAEKLTAYKILHLARPDQLFDEDIIKLYDRKISAYDEKDKEAILKTAKKSFPVRKPNTYENLLLEINREKLNKQAWREAFVPPYFESVWGKAFLEREKEKENNTEKNSESNEQTNTKRSEETKKETKYIGPSYDDPEYTNKKRSPLPPIAKQNSIPTDKIDDDQLKQSLTFYHTKDLDRLNLLKVPNSIKATRPNAVPNVEFWTIENPVRRKTKNSSIKTSMLNGKSLERRRGCEVYPSQIRFGLLKDGCTYAFDIELTNVGIDLCRFKIKQFPPETGLSINYKPGPIAPGMTKYITILLNATFNSEIETVEQVSPAIIQLKHELEITTETDIIQIPVEAEIASADEYHKMFRGNLEAGKTVKTRIVSVNPINKHSPLIRLTNRINDD